jgi:DNA primase
LLDIVARLDLGDPVKRGKEVRVLCPFHDDHRPSLRIQLEKGLWYCDPCAIGGDGISLVERQLGVDFATAVRWIAEVIIR